MHRQGREVRHWTDYLLRTEHGLLQNASIWDPPAQLGPLHGLRVPPQHRPEGALPISKTALEVFPVTTADANMGGTVVLRPATGNPQAPPNKRDDGTRGFFAETWRLADAGAAVQ